MINYYKYENDGAYMFVRTPGPAFIPQDDGNSDYLEFLSYLAVNGITIDDIQEWEP